MECQLHLSFSLSFNLGDLLSPLKSLVREQSAVLEFNAGAQNTRVGQIKGRTKSVRGYHQDIIRLSFL